MKIATFNVNSIRRRLNVVTRWLRKHSPEVLCLQETKVQDVEFPLDVLAKTGYHVTFRGMKGYNGVATLSLAKPEFVSYGLGNGPDADEPRLIHTVFSGFTVLNTYIPQGFRIDSPKYQYKIEWFQRLRRYFSKHFTPDQPIIWVGDMNVAPDWIDVHSPEKHLTHVCFHEAVKTAYAKTVKWGFYDVFRLLYPDRQQFTFWDYRQPSALSTNRGWRIDHILATHPLATQCTNVEVDVNPRKRKSPSDHTVLWADFSCPEFKGKL